MSMRARDKKTAALFGLSEKMGSLERGVLGIPNITGVNLDLDGLWSNAYMVIITPYYDKDISADDRLTALKEVVKEANNNGMNCSQETIRKLTLGQIDLVAYVVAYFPKEWVTNIATKVPVYRQYYDKYDVPIGEGDTLTLPNGLTAVVVRMDDPEGNVDFGIMKFKSLSDFGQFNMKVLKKAGVKSSCQYDTETVIKEWTELASTYQDWYDRFKRPEDLRVADFLKKAIAVLDGSDCTNKSSLGEMIKFIAKFNENEDPDHITVSGRITQSGIQMLCNLEAALESECS